MEKEFLRASAAYYGAQVYKAAFDGQTLRDINEWVRQNTDGSIDRVLEELPDEARLYLINTLCLRRRMGGRIQGGGRPQRRLHRPLGRTAARS